MLMESDTKQIEVSRLETLYDIDDLQPEWQALEERSSGVTPFMTWEWCSAVARIRLDGQGLLIMAVRKDGELIGVAPFAEMTMGGLRVLRLLSSGLGEYSLADYQDLLLAEGHEEEGIDALCLDFAKRRWDLLHLQELPAASSNTKRLMEAAARRGWIPQLQSASDVHLLPVAGAWDEYRATLSRSTRNDGGRLTRKLMAEHDASFLNVDGDEEQIARTMETLFDLHTQRWRAVGKPGIFHTEQQKDLHREVARRFAARGMLALSCLRAGDETIAVKYGFQKNGVRYYYSSGFSADPRWEHFRLGLVLDLGLLKDAFDQGIRCVDFMRGDSHYKNHYRMDTHLNQELTLFRNRRVRLQYQIARFAERAVRGMRRKLVWSSSTQQEKAA
jgi:CelD/BcsL family acetyltransferase involved in cellulose biosynthesis